MKDSVGENFKAIEEMGIVSMRYRGKFALIIRENGGI